MFAEYKHTSQIDGKQTIVDVGYERFLGPEMFFHPEFLHSDWRTPLDECVDNAIQSCPIDTRRELYNSVILSGGSTLFDGFDTRLEKGIQGRVNERLSLYEQATGKKPAEIKVNVSQNMVQKYAVWFGGSVLGANANFHRICHSREDYLERGPSICRHNSVFGEM